MRRTLGSVGALFSASMLWSGARADAQAQPDSARQVTVIVSARTLPRPAQAAVLTGIAGLVDTVSWPTVRVREGDRLYALVYEQYGYTDRQMHLRDAVSNVIAKANRLPDVNTLRVGQDLMIPVLPNRPSSDADAGLAQLLVADSASLRLTSVREATIERSPSSTTEGELSAGATWVLRGTPERAAAFLDSLPSEVLEREIGRTIYVGQPEEYAELEPAAFGSLDPQESPPQWTTTALPALSGLDPAAAGKLYVFDRFKHSSPDGRTHGAMVLDVVRQALVEHGASQLAANVQPVELDFYADKARAAAEVRQFIGRFTDRGTREALTAALNRLLAVNAAPKGALYVPCLYLQALYSNRLRDAVPAVITSSFFTTSDGVLVVPREYLPSSAAVLVAAALDDAGSIAERTPFREPIRTFVDGRRDYGMVLVGAEAKRGVPFGMTSMDGTGVTTLERGSGWGTPGATIRPADRGTSFATPAVATVLFIARAVWQSRGERMSAFDAKMRLLLSADVVPAYVGKYASGGPPRLDLLLKPSGTYALRPDGSVVPIHLQHGRLEVREQAGDASVPFVFRRGDPGVRAIAVVDGQVLLFSNSRQSWFAAEVTALSITVREGGIARTFSSVREFSTHYKEIVLL